MASTLTKESDSFQTYLLVALSKQIHHALMKLAAERKVSASRTRSKPVLVCQVEIVYYTTCILSFHVCGVLVWNYLEGTNMTFFDFSSLLPVFFGTHGICSNEHETESSLGRTDDFLRNSNSPIC